MDTLVYFIRETFRGFFQAKLMTAVSIVTIAVSLFILGGALIAAYNARLLFLRVSDQIDIMAYVQDSLAENEDALNRLAGGIRTIPGIKTAVVVDKEEAMRRFRAAYGSRLLDAVNENPLPASVEVTLFPEYRTPARAEGIANEIKSNPGIEQASYSAPWFARMQHIRSYLYGGAAVLGIICLMILHFIVSNTVKLTIYARKDLVTNMRYVGATDAFIRTPFILEGILQGLLGALISLGCLWLLKPFAGTFLLGWGPSFLIPLLLSVGGLFGWSGSASAVRKFLL